MVLLLSLSLTSFPETPSFYPISGQEEEEEKELKGERRGAGSEGFPRYMFTFLLPCNFLKSGLLVKLITESPLGGHQN